jgi:AraC-like DNA-binding protein
MKIETAQSFDLTGAALAAGAARAPLLDAFEPELLSCLFWKTGPVWWIPTRVLGDSMLFVPVRGVIQVTSGSRRAQAGPGQVVLFTEGIPHTASYARDSSRLHVYALHLRFMDSLGRQGFALFDSLAPVLPEAAAWHRRLRALTTLFNRDRQAGQSAGRVLLRALLLDLVLNGTELVEPKSGVDPRIQRVLSERTGADRTELTVAALARRAGMSSVQFRKHFVRALGISPKRYLARERLRRAADLLRRSDNLVKTVAMDAGFASDTYFEQRFKRAYGATPSAYRQRHRGTGI